MMEAILLIIIAVIAFITRIINLLAIPIFTDEAIYIRWAQIGLNDPAHRYISLTDGKQPLFTWLMYPFLLIFSDPLFAGRFVSVLSSVAAVCGIYFVARELFGKKAAVFAVLLYIISPFAAIYDRLALMDSLLAMLGIWSLYLSILLVRKVRLDVALLLGLTVGLGVLTKSSAFFYLYLLPAGLLLFNFKVKNSWHKFISWIGLALLSFSMAQIMYNSLRLSPWFYIIKQKNYSFILTLSEFLQAPFTLFTPNLTGLLRILFSYLTLPIGMIAIVGVVRGILNRDKRIIFLLFWFLFPFLALTAFGKVIFPRFILFMIMPLLVISSYVLANFSSFAYKKLKVLLVLVVLALLVPAYQTSLAVFSPVNVSIHEIDRNQLFDDWPSGYGVKEVISFLEEKAKHGKVVIGTEGTFGLFPAVFEIYLGRNPNVEIHGYWPVSGVPPELLEKANQYPTYLVFKETQKVPSSLPLTLVAKYPRGRGNTYLLFYQVNPPK